MSDILSYILRIRFILPKKRYLTLQESEKCALKTMLILLPTILLSPLLTSCFTGIEGTKKITLSKEEIKKISPTPEETILSDVIASPFIDWNPGKKFFVSDGRASLLLNPEKIISGNDSLFRGDIIDFETARPFITPDGDRTTMLLFRRGEDIFDFTVSNIRGNRRDSLTAVDIPGIIDLDMIYKAGEILRHKRVWTLSSLCFDEQLNRIPGRKFVAVTIDSVVPGNMVFPLVISVHYDNGAKARFLMNFGSSGKDSRSFANLFSLSDPRLKYPGISDHNWDNITNERVEKGMTKEEVRLAKGNPSEVNTGHNYSHDLLLWGYPDGNLLYFEDGLLVGINKFEK